MNTVCFDMIVDTDKSFTWQSTVTVTILIGVDKAVLYVAVVPAIARV